jgi:HD-GYP domain-containing protein (c-di-GMP phosphodiesterase class II)
MNAGFAHADVPPAHRTFVERCRGLSLPAWIFGAGENAEAPPSGWGDADAWLRAPLLGQMIARVRAAWRPSAPPAHAELLPGCWLLPVAPALSDPDARGAVVLALGPQILDASLFGAIARSGRVEPRVAREALRTVAIHDRTALPRLASVARWMLADLVTNEQQVHALGNFSQQLVDTYEQMSMLYQLAELMNGLGDARGVVRRACELLHQTLEFEWVAVRFGALTTLGRALANELVLVGKVPGSYTRFDRIAGALARDAEAHDRPIVLDPQKHELARLVQAEVFVNPLVCDNDAAGLLIVGNKRGRDTEISTIDMQLVSATSDYVSAFIHNSALYGEQRTMFLGIVRALSGTIDAKDRYTRGHSERVAQLSTEIAVQIGMTEEQAERVRLAGILHDLGKIGVPEAVLLKPGRLTAEEFDAIKRHPTIGYNILKDIEPLQDVLPGVLHHHERWDGKGYPHGLKGGDIPLLGRILAVADAFDAMSSDRAYRPRMARESVLMEMRKGAGTQWDAEMVKAFLRVELTKYDSMLDKHAAQSAIAA